jgi:diguanylate cyclase (GGDEF)-like protein
VVRRSLACSPFTAPLVLVLALVAPAAAQEAPPIVVSRLPASLAGEWLFHMGHDPAFASPFRERRNWRQIRVPGAWEKQGWAGYDGHAWYCVRLFIASALEGVDLGLDLGRVGDVDEVFLNGREIGSTGAFPPSYDKATLARRFYLVPREVVRFGQYNELAIHVYNDSGLGGLLGPAPQLDTYAALLGRAVLRDAGAYCLATLLLALAAFQLALFLGQRDALEHLEFAGFLAATAAMFLTFTHWGPSLLLGYSATFRINLAALLAAVAVFPSVPYRLARRRQPAVLLGTETLLAFAAVFALAWRDEASLYPLSLAADAATVLVMGVTLRLQVKLLRGRRPWGAWMLASSGVFFSLVAVDIASEIGVLPRFRFLTGEMLFPVALAPFAFSFSAALAQSWVERRWGESADSATGLMSHDRFVDRLNGEIQRWQHDGGPLTVALLRLGYEHGVGQGPSPAGVILRLRTALRQVDLLARYDADTFVILLADTEERAAAALVDRLRRSIREHSPGPDRLHAAAGVAQYRPGRHLAAEELLHEAQAALYAALSEGGDCTATAP